MSCLRHRILMCKVLCRIDVAVTVDDHATQRRVPCCIRHKSTLHTVVSPLRHRHHHPVALAMTQYNSLCAADIDALAGLSVFILP